MGNGETIYDSLRKEPLMDRGVYFSYRAQRILPRRINIFVVYFR